MPEGVVVSLYILLPCAILDAYGFAGEFSTNKSLGKVTLTQISISNKYGETLRENHTPELCRPNRPNIKIRKLYSENRD